MNHTCLTISDASLTNCFIVFCAWTRIFNEYLTSYTRSQIAGRSRFVCKHAIRSIFTCCFKTKQFTSSRPTRRKYRNLSLVAHAALMAKKKGKPERVSSIVTLFVYYTRSCSNTHVILNF